ncbi:MAG: tail fiber domain-containing protein [Bacteroidota bacterium]
MKTKILLLSLAICISYSITWAQPTSYGNLNQGNAGDLGLSTNSYFGYEAGINTTSYSNTFIGYQSGFSNTTGASNVATGYRALYNNTEGSQNTATGVQALYFNTTGNHNTATGYRALYFNTTGQYNVASGHHALHNNTTGTYNTAHGISALNFNTTGDSNTATGARALYYNTTGNGNVATGRQALHNNTIGANNTATGNTTLYLNETGSNNTATGAQALRNNTTGTENTATGRHALYNNTTGFENTATGSLALSRNTYGTENTAIGYHTLYENITGSHNTALGTNAGPSFGNAGLNNTTALGHDAMATASNQVVLGDAAVTQIGGVVDFTPISDGRFKNTIKEDVPGLAFIEKLRPVSYNLDRNKLHTFLKGEAPEKAIPSDRHTGFIAQEVAEVVAENAYAFWGVKQPTNDTDTYGIQYAQFVVPLVKAVQELSTENEQQKQLIEALQQRIESLESANTDKVTDNLQSKETERIVKGFSLHQNTPNPFHQTTTINAVVPENVQQAKIIVYNLQGLELESYMLHTRGTVSLEISGGHFPSGMYLYTLVADDRVIDTKKMILTR